MNRATQFLLALLMQTLLCTTQLYSQCNPAFFKTPEELVRNRLSGDGNYYGHPYTMFNKRYDQFNIDEEIANIRNQILSEIDLGVGPLKKAYSDIWEYANYTRESRIVDPYHSPYSELALWTKYNAFILLVGLNDAGEDINREIYLNRVYEGFEHMEYEETDDNGEVIKYANSAMCWIQAYDLYKTFRWYADPQVHS